MPPYTRYGRRVAKRRALRTRKRTVRRRRKPMVQMVKRIARTVQLKNSETKRNFVLNESYNYYPTTGSYNINLNFTNIFGVLGQGAGSTNFVGDDIQDPLFVAKFRFLINWDVQRAATGLTRCEPIILHAWIISTNDQYGSVIPTNYNTYTGQIDWILQSDGPTIQMNGDNCRVLKHWSKVINPPAIAAPSSTSPTFPEVMIRKNFKYKWKGKKVFESSTTASTDVPTKYLRGQQYYFMVGWGLPTSVTFAAPPANNPVRIHTDRYLYFKDI